MQEINSKKFNTLLYRAKSIMDVYRITKDEKKTLGLKKKAEEICMILANFQCEKCKSEEELTIHHMVMKKMYYYMSPVKYVIQRHHWSNMVLLCKNCHSDLHNICGEDVEKMGVISQEKIDNIKKKYLREMKE